MKKIIFISTIFLFIVACDPNPTTVENSESITTKQIINVANSDTLYYKVAEISDVVYILKDDLVVKKVSNDIAFMKELTIVVLLIGLIIGVIIGIKISE